MKTYARPIIMALAVLGLAASLAALYVHYQMLRDPAYSSFCDVSETVSCEAVLGSQYSYLFGMPVAAGGAIWSALVLLLSFQGMRGRNTDQTAAVAGYVFVLSTIGLAVVLYLGYASFFVIQKACPLCMAMYVAVIGTFLVSGAAASVSLGTLPSRAMKDVAALPKSPVAAALAVIWLVASASLMAFFPKGQPPPQTTEAAAQAAVPATETLDEPQRVAFDKWLDAQPRVNVPFPTEGAAVMVVKFNDYQCPACRQSFLEYRGIVAKYGQPEYAGKVRFVTLDFPLEAECNLGNVHPAACEAAAAMRMARAKGKGEAMEEWLYANQPTLTRETVKNSLRDIAQVADFDAQYAATLEQVKAEAKLGRDLGVSGTPTFFVNGIKLPSLRPIYFDAVIAHELQRAEAPKTD